MPNDNQQLHKESIKYLTTVPLRENDPKFICAISDVAYELLTTDIMPQKKRSKRSWTISLRF